MFYKLKSGTIINLNQICSIDNFAIIDYGDYRERNHKYYSFDMSNGKTIQIGREEAELILEKLEYLKISEPEIYEAP